MFSNPYVKTRAFQNTGMTLSNLSGFHALKIFCSLKIQKGTMQCSLQKAERQHDSSYQPTTRRGPMFRVSEQAKHLSKNM